MLFDPRPKEKREELFDREKELSSLTYFVEAGSPLILCLGIRRIGKTSLVKVFLNENNLPSIYIDARRLSDYGYSRAGLYSILSKEFTRIRGRFREIVEYLKHLRGITIEKYTIVFDWKSKELSITSILEETDGYARDRGTVFLFVVDEAQELRFLKGYRKPDFRKIIAYTYDNLKNIKFVLTGSEIGMLYDFLELDRRESPLYGRVYDEIIVERFDEEKSIEFLETGFLEAGVKVQRRELEKVVGILDGIPGWLAFYGYEAVKKRRTDILDNVLAKAVDLALSELKKLASLSENYRYVLRAIAMGFKNWSSIKKAVEAWTGRHLPDKTLRRSLKRLADMSIIAKKNNEYSFLDPIYREASKQL